MEEEVIVQDNVSEEVVTPQIEETQTEVTEPTELGVNEEITEPQQVVEEPQQQIQTPEQNAQFAKIRRESEQRGMDRAIEMMGLEFNGQPIKTQADYQKALQMQKYMEEAQKQGIDPEFYSQFKEMQDKLQGYEKEKSFLQEDSELSKDPIRSNVYNTCKDEVRQMSEEYGVGLRTAFTLYVESNLDKILENAQKTATNNAIKNIETNKNTTPGALGQQAEQPSANPWDLSDVEFEEMVQKAKMGQLR